MYWKNKIELAEGKPSLLIFYHLKGNPLRDDDTNIVRVDEDPKNIGVYEGTYEEPQDEYETIDVDIGKYEKQDDQEYHEEEHNSHEHNIDNIDLPQDDNHDAPKEQ